MKCRGWYFAIINLFVFTLSSCSYYSGVYSETPDNMKTAQTRNMPPPDYSSRLPQHIAASEKTILVDPRVHAWGAYDSDGNLVRAGLATAGGDWCPDIGRACHTRPGSFRIFSLGSPECKSTLYPLPKGGAPMPYCMFFNGNQGLHGSYQVVEGNVSHGCVRLEVSDAEWIRYDFANMGTRVIIKPYY